MESLLRPRLTPPVALVRERRTATAQAGDASLFGTMLVHAINAPFQRIRMSNGQSKIRMAGRAARSGLSAEDRSRASEKICQRLMHSELFRNATTVACYIGIEPEVSTQPIFERAYAEKKRIFAPVTQRNFKMIFREMRPDTALLTTAMGLFEPVTGEETDPRNLDLVVTPLVAFDDQRNRVGMGGGYYDRAFAFLRDNSELDRPRLVGLAFDCQKTRKITPNPWDIPLFRVFTETVSY